MDCLKKRSNLLIIDSEIILDFSITFFQKKKLSGSYYVTKIYFINSVC